MIYHTTALAAGFLLDLIFGDPRWLYHPVCLIGNLISVLEKGIRKIFPKTNAGELAGGFVETLLVCLFSFGIPGAILYILYGHFPLAGVILETFWCYQLLATRSLRDESMKVHDRLINGTIEEARYAVSMIVGRDTQELTETGVTKAAVETVAENCSDGVIAPMIYMALGGAPLMFLYKGINTMDSMLGYKNDKYLYFGRCSAKLDDVANYLPARISGWLMVAASFVCGMDGKNAAKIYLRDRRNHASPNSAQTEAAMAGALDVQLAGNAYYFGKLYEKPTIGDPIREVEPEDIRRSNRLMYGTAVLGILICLIIRIAVGFWIL
ncbi:MAG: adenosylcobinamide-phosphate synthase CbiB [Eubacteriales bacterium]|nr:adenosylcobinamide-phosphate synthase CbiB [Eubacteriales bacterium]